jgi:hypothetical protein
MSKQARSPFSSAYTAIVALLLSIASSTLKSSQKIWQKQMLRPRLRL